MCTRFPIKHNTNQKLILLFLFSYWKSGNIDKTNETKKFIWNLSGMMSFKIKIKKWKPWIWFWIVKRTIWNTLVVFVWVLEILKIFSFGHRTMPVQMNGKGTVHLISFFSNPVQYRTCTVHVRVMSRVVYKQAFKNDKNDEFLLTLWNLLKLWIPLLFLAVFSKLLKIIRLSFNWWRR